LCKFINQYKNSSDEGMRAWAELYKSDERTRRLSRIVFLIVFMIVSIFAIMVVYYSFKNYVG
jgi:type VI protein secretion system component VasF